MSLPPPPGSFGSVPPNGGGGASWGGQPQQPGQPYGAPYPGQPGGQWASPQQWAGGPPNKGGKGKWILIGLALVAVIAVSIVGTVLVLRSDSSGGNGGRSTPSAQTGNSEFASANDVGPASVITEDPTCTAWGRIFKDYVDATKAVGWSNRDPQVSRSDWNPQQKSMYEAVAKAQEIAAKGALNLTKTTPHRVMRELYGQFAAYAQAFNEAVPNYVPGDNNLTATTDSVSSALGHICSAISYGSAAPAAAMSGQPEGPTQVSTPTDGDPSRMLTSRNDTCDDFSNIISAYDDSTVEWREIDPNLKATDWNPQQKAVSEAAASVMTDSAVSLDEWGRKTGIPALEDIAVLAGQYRRAFAQVIPTYTPADNSLGEAAVYLVRTINFACKATA